MSKSQCQIKSYFINAKKKRCPGLEFNFLTLSHLIFIWYLSIDIGYYKI